MPNSMISQNTRDVITKAQGADKHINQLARLAVMRREIESGPVDDPFREISLQICTALEQRITLNRNGD